MKHNIRVVLCATLALFAVLGGYLLYATYSYGGRWFTTPYNTRLRNVKNSVIPVNITDRNGTVLVATDADGLREYPVGDETRRAVSHVIGDTQGDVPTGAETFLAADLLGFNASLTDRIAQLFVEKRRGSDVQKTIDAALQTFAAQQYPK